jgi:GNAT superfamily N-acetyltransferase
MMKPILLRLAEPERDFGQLAAWFTILEDEPNTEPGLKVYYQKNQERIIQAVAEDERGELLGFYWGARDRQVPERMTFYLFVKPEQRGQGLGGRLHQALEQASAAAGGTKLHVRVWDDCPECRAFAERRGFSERSHQMAMRLDLAAFDDLPYDEIIARLEGEGFLFTSMEALGNTEGAQRKLYALNDMTAMDIPGSDGEHAWETFEDFRQSVCQADWYRPAGQMVAIDQSTGDWAAMSAITRMEGVDYAYNLHTGVDKRYRGRKLAQAVKVTALRYAREVLKTSTVRTHHNTRNLPMIAIDRKLGYVQTPGTFLMEKNLEQVG